jgi:hypothetical protein
MIAAASSVGAVMRRAASRGSRSARECRYSSDPGVGMTIPSAAAASRTRSVEDSFAISDSISAFWRSSVPAVVTAREMPAFSLSSDTCIATIPPSSRPISQIHARPRSRPSTRRVSGSARMRSKTPVEPRRSGGPAGTGRATGPETRRWWRGAGRALTRACAAF